MREFLELVKSGNAWIRMGVAVIIGTFIAGMYFTNLKHTLGDHEKRIVNFEKVAEMIPTIKESLARIEGSMRIRK